MKPYLTKEKEWTGQQIKPFEFQEGYPLLFASAEKYKCKDCKEAVKTIDGAEAGKLRELLIY